MTNTVYWSESLLTGSYNVRHLGHVKHLCDDDDDSLLPLPLTNSNVPLHGMLSKRVFPSNTTHATYATQLT